MDSYNMNVKVPHFEFRVQHSGLLSLNGGIVMQGDSSASRKRFVQAWWREIVCFVMWSEYNSKISNSVALSAYLFYTCTLCGECVRRHTSNWNGTKLPHHMHIDSECGVNLRAKRKPIPSSLTIISSSLRWLTVSNSGQAVLVQIFI